MLRNVKFLAIKIVVFLFKYIDIGDPNLRVET